MRQVAGKGVGWYLETPHPQNGAADPGRNVALDDGEGLKEEGDSLRFGLKRKQKKDLHI